MKNTGQVILGALLLVGVLTACGPSQVEVEKLIADAVAASETVQAQKSSESSPEYSIQSCVDFGITIFLLLRQYDDNVISPEEYIERAPSSWTTQEILDMNDYCWLAEWGLKHSNNIEKPAGYIMELPVIATSTRSSIAETP